MKSPPLPATTGIGSLPHHNVDAALDFAFKTSIPFLPQIPIRNSWEFMIAQALEGIPGLFIEKDGVPMLDLGVWVGRSRDLSQRLQRAFDSMDKHHAFEEFEPSAATASCWQPFLWELSERKCRFAKVQLAGPLTSQWVLRSKGGESLEKYPEVSTQIFRLNLARALAMGRRLQSMGVTPILYLDEPALYGLKVPNPKHVTGLQELRLVIQALKKEKILVGLHCCSNTDWQSVLGLQVDVLSFDTKLSLSSVLLQTEALNRFIENGGTLSLGIVPTNESREEFMRTPASDLFESVQKELGKFLGNRTKVEKLLKNSLFTPACGLALRDPSDAEAILGRLLEVIDFI